MYWGVYVSLAIYILVVFVAIAIGKRGVRIEEE